MRIIITKDYQEMAKVAKQHLLGVMFAKADRVNLAITGGKTPIEVYCQLIPEVKGKAYLDHVHYYNFDEIPYKKSNREGITISDLRELYLDPANIPAENIHVLDENNYEGQDERIRQAGGLDAVLMGIGTDGHFCGNLPGTTTINDYTARVDCNEDMKKELAGMYDDPADIPDYYVTMGPKSIMAAKQLILIANGEGKADIIKTLIEEDISSDIPASILKLHPNLTVILDQAAASKLSSLS